MHCLNYRIGILFRQNLQKKSYEMRYFFIDDEGNLCYVSSLARLQKVIRLSSDFKDIHLKLLQMGQKSFSLTRYTISGPRNYTSDAILPFSNRTCIDIKQKEGKDERGYQLFGIVDEDTPLLLQQIHRIVGRKKVTVQKRKSVYEQEKSKHELRTVDFFNRFLINKDKFKMEHVGEENGQIEFQGDMPADEANGKCVQTLIKQGITYTGYFKNGKKHGLGLLVSDSLDSFDCEFIEDELAGI